MTVNHLEEEMLVGAVENSKGAVVLKILEKNMEAVAREEVVAAAASVGGEEDHQNVVRHKGEPGNKL